MALLKKIRLIGAIAAVVGASSAMAGQIVVTDRDSAHLGGASGVGYQPGQIAPNPTVDPTNLVNVGIGGDWFRPGGLGLPSGGFDAWCIDIYHWLTAPKSTYEVLGGGELATALEAQRPAPPTGATRVNDLQKLADSYYGALTHSQVDSAAFQLAVWAIGYGERDASGSYDLNNTSSGFRVDSGTLGSAAGVMADSWLNTLSSKTVTNAYNLIYLSDFPNGSTQDMVVFVKNPPGQVPEPGSMALVGLALLGLGLVRRRQV